MWESYIVDYPKSEFYYESEFNYLLSEFKISRPYMRNNKRTLIMSYQGQTGYIYESDEGAVIVDIGVNKNKYLLHNYLFRICPELKEHGIKEVTMIKGVILRYFRFSLKFGITPGVQ